MLLAILTELLSLWLSEGEKGIVTTKVVATTVPAVLSHCKKRLRRFCLATSPMSAESGSSKIKLNPIHDSLSTIQHRHSTPTSSSGRQWVWEVPYKTSIYKALCNNSIWCQQLLLLRISRHGFIKQTRNKKGEIMRLACGIIRHGLPADSVDHSENLLLSLYLVQPVPISPNNMD